MPVFKLIDFDAACMVGEPVTHGTVDYSSPEAARGEMATFAMDLYSLGRIIHWLSCRDTNLWLGMTDGDKEAFLQSTVEFGLDNIDDVATRRIVRRLTCKNPSKRYDLPHLKVLH
jgi:serine/threonine protein kinase